MAEKNPPPRLFSDTLKELIFCWHQYKHSKYQITHIFKSVKKMNASLKKIISYLMARSAGLFEERVYFSSPFGVIFSTKLTSQTVSYFSTRTRPVMLIDMKGLEPG